MADISVILPCYNVESYIDRCLTSITLQTIGMDALEIICIDDASTDGTWNHLQEWEQKYPENIMLVHCDVNGRQGTARNIGLQYASTDWIAFIDSDDWLELDYFEKLYSITQMGDFDIVSCQNKRDFSSTLTFFDDRGTGRENRFMLIDTVEKRKLFFNLQSAGLGACNKIIRKELLIDNHIYFPENLAYEDCYWGPLLHFYAKRVYLIEENLYHYFVNRHSTVLQMDADYHTDWLTVQSMKWDEWVQRGFLADYREELEYDFLCTCYLGFLKIIFLRYTEPSYSLYLLVKEITLEKVSDYRQNKYIKEGLSEFYSTLIETLLLPLDKSQFQQLARNAKAYWNAKQ
ncbi:MAG: glycosyltransferase family 2 protein [Bacillota bacterium]|nr:glycosyltransferase family 2 protein [Bacillota bacterium]